MGDFILEGSAKTPVVELKSSGDLLLKGRSIPENSIEFYKPIIDWIDSYSQSVSEKTVLSVQLEYFNTSSSKCILDVFKKLESLSGTNVEVKWYYEEDDEDMLEAGSVMGILRSSGKAIQRTTKGFLGRILDFVGTIILGWAILNLPKIIKITQDVIKRMQKYFAVLTKFVNDIALLFTDFRNKITEIATTLLPFDFEKFNNSVKTFMNKIRNAFDQLVLNTIKTVKVLTDKSERQLAYDIGLGELYDRMNNKQDDNQQEDNTQEGGEEEGGDEDVQIDEKEEIDRLIQGGIEVLKEKRGGELTKVDKRKIQGKEPLDIYRYLLDQEIGLYINERDGVMGFMSLEGYNAIVKNNPDLLNFLKPVPVSDNPFDMSNFEASGFSDDSSIFDNLRERYYDFEGEMSDKFDSMNPPEFMYT